MRPFAPHEEEGLPTPERSVQRADDDQDADPHEDPGPWILVDAGAHARRVRILRAAARTVAGEEDHRQEGDDREREPPPSNTTPDRCTHDETVRRRRLPLRAGPAGDVDPRHTGRMSMRIAAVPLLSAVAVLSACAPAPVVDGTVVPTEGPHGELTASTFVLDDGDGAELCLGGVGRSLPPVCGGPTVTGWNWDDVEGEESLSGSTWGDYEVVGTWDGTSFALTRTPVFSDPLAPSTATPRPEPTPGDPANADAVARAVEDYSNARGTATGPLLLGEYRGRAWVLVVHDDGTLQAEADAEYGDDVVVIESRLRPAGVK